MSYSEVPLWKLLRIFGESAARKIVEQGRKLSATHVVCFENLAMDSSAFGNRTAVLVGPTCTHKTPSDCTNGWLNDLPSQRQYPTCWAKLPDDLEEQP